MQSSDFPQTLAWFESLGSRGLEAYPQCLASTRLPLSIDAEFPTLKTLPKLPPLWRQALAAPMPEGGWIPETTLVLQYLLLRDAFFKDDFSFLMATKKRVKNSFLHPTIRPLMALMSPHLLILGAGRRWGTYHRGSTLTVTSKSAHTLTGRLEFPPGLYPPLMIKDTHVAIEASIEMTGKRITHMVAEITAPGVCSIAGAWD